MSSIASKSYEEQKAQFIKDNWKDKYYTFWLEEIVSGYVANTLIVNTDKGDHKYYLNRWTVLLMDILVLGWIPRL
jgi:hypothetical protein